ncbi:MAG: hypothetical protein ACE5K0_08550 [Candidatus Methanofastidiosia archaeon]
MIHADWIEFENATSKNTIKVLKEAEQDPNSMQTRRKGEKIESQKNVWNFSEWRRERKNIWALQLEKKGKIF